MKLKKIVGNGVSQSLEFDNGTIISDLHYQDCCERVYADFNYLKEDGLVWNHIFKDEVVIEGVVGAGIMDKNRKKINLDNI